MCKTSEGIVIPNFAALLAAVFLLSTKNVRGWGGYPPSPSVRGLKAKLLILGKICGHLSEKALNKLLNTLFAAL